MIEGTHALAFLLVWLTGVLVHGILRSAGQAEQDPVRPSGPIGVFSEEVD